VTVGVDQGAVRFDELVRAALAITGGDMGNIQLIEDGALRLVASYGFERPFLDFFDLVADQDSACGAALQAHEPIVVEDVRTSPIFAGKPSQGAMLAAGALSVVSSPLVTGRGRTVGMLSVHRRVAATPSDAELRSINLLAGRFADHIDGRAGSPSFRLMAQSHRLIERSARLRRAKQA
jgi:GAF domain-containing protein